MLPRERTHLGELREEYRHSFYKKKVGGRL